MVRAFYPQGRNGSIVANTNFPPQNSSSGSGGGGVNTFNDEAYVNGGQRGSVKYVFGGDSGKVDYMDVI